MCQGCEDIFEWGRVMDAYMAKELPKMMIQELDYSVLQGHLDDFQVSNPPNE